MFLNMFFFMLLSKLSISYHKCRKRFEKKQKNKNPKNFHLIIKKTVNTYTKIYHQNEFNYSSLK